MSKKPQHHKFYFGAIVKWVPTTGWIPDISGAPAPIVIGVVVHVDHREVEIAWQSSSEALGHGDAIRYCKFKKGTEWGHGSWELI